MARRWPAAAFALLLAAGCTGSGSPDVDPLAEAPPTTARAAGGYGEPAVLGEIADRAVAESSGLAASRRNPGLLWTHNDSDDAPLLYCLDLEGASCGRWRVTGAEAFDWEDMAAGPGPQAGEPYLYVGDIGDNLDQRREVVVYRVPEPEAPADSPSAATAPAEALRLRYPDGPHNAEALLVHPATADLYVIAKDAQSAGVYKASAPLEASRVATMVRVGAIRLGAGTRGLEQVTGGDISPDGRRVAVSTYGQGYELELPQDAAAFDDIWAGAPVPVVLGTRIQGEAIAYRLDGRALLTTSEVAPSPLLQVERR
ncbi:MAG TPA: hypothetical protein VHF27_10460 [Acidimicrobiales bacterium]|nr:hypothetical protein [Acidimicrobiales bacterium]